MTTETKRKMTEGEAKSFGRYSVFNAAIVRHALACGCEPYKDVFTFGRWIAQGFSVMKGEKSIKIPVVRTEDKEDGTTAKIFHNSPVFCRHQVSKRESADRTTEVGKARIGKVAESKTVVTSQPSATSLTRHLNNSTDRVTRKEVAKTAYKLCSEHIERDYSPADITHSIPNYNKSHAISIHNDFIEVLLSECTNCLALSAGTYWDWFDKQGKMKIQMPKGVWNNLQGKYQYCHGVKGLAHYKDVTSNTWEHREGCCDKARWNHWQDQAGRGDSIPLTYDSPEVIEMIAFNESQGYKPYR